MLMTTLLQQQAAELFDLTFSDAHVEAFDHFTTLLVDWNTRMNLTAITDPEGMRVRHFLDSLSIAHAFPLKDGMKVIDVGTGAGFPGLPLAILYPSIRVVLLESTGKKVAFLDHVIDELGLRNAYTVNARAEEAAHEQEHRAKYDLVLARAVARMPALMEYLLPFARKGGRCIAMKGVTAEEETNDARYALQILGGQVKRIDEVRLPGLDNAHYLVHIDKIEPTPRPYPRNPGTPTRSPLMP